MAFGIQQTQHCPAKTGLRTTSLVHKTFRNSELKLETKHIRKWMLLTSLGGLMEGKVRSHTRGTQGPGPAPAGSLRARRRSRPFPCTELHTCETRARQLGPLAPLRGSCACSAAAWDLALNRGSWKPNPGVPAAQTMAVCQGGGKGHQPPKVAGIGPVVRIRKYPWT